MRGLRGLWIGALEQSSWWVCVFSASCGSPTTIAHAGDDAFLALRNPPPIHRPSAPRPCRYGRDAGGSVRSVKQLTELLEPQHRPEPVRVRGIIHVEFEDARLYDSTRKNAFSIWLNLTAEQERNLRHCDQGEVIVEGSAYVFDAPHSSSDPASRLRFQIFDIVSIDEAPPP